MLLDFPEFFKNENPITINKKINSIYGEQLSSLGYKNYIGGRSSINNLFFKECNSHTFYFDVVDLSVSINVGFFNVSEDLINRVNRLLEKVKVTTFFHIPLAEIVLYSKFRKFCEENDIKVVESVDI